MKGREPRSEDLIAFLQVSDIGAAETLARGARALGINGTRIVAKPLVANIDRDEVRLASYKNVIPHTVAFLLRLQYIPENTYYVQHRERVIGGFKKDLINSVLWMDSVWHLTSAFIKIQQSDLLD